MINITGGESAKKEHLRLDGLRALGMVLWCVFQRFVFEQLDKATIGKKCTFWTKFYDKIEIFPIEIVVIIEHDSNSIQKYEYC